MVVGFEISGVVPVEILFVKVDSITDNIQQLASIGILIDPSSLETVSVQTQRGNDRIAVRNFSALNGTRG